MLLASSGGGGKGRDVIFRLRAEYDPASNPAFKKMVDEMTKAQKMLTDQAVKGAVQVAKAQEQEQKKLKSNEAREKAKELADQFKRDKMIADNYLKTHLKAIDDRAKAEKKARDEEIRLAQQRDKIIADNHLKEHLKSIEARKRQESDLAKWKERVRNNSFAMEERINAREAALAMRRDRAKDRALGGVIGGAGDLARGAAYTGLMGSDNSQAILSTVLGIEGGAALYRGGKGMIGGIGTLATGGAAQGGAAMAAGAPFAAAAAAIAGMTAAAVSFAGFIRNASKYGIGGGAPAGSFTDTIATKEVEIAGWMVRGQSDEQLKKFRSPSNAAYIDAEISRRELQRQGGAGATQSAARDQRAQMISGLGQLQRSGYSNMDTAKSDLASNYGLFTNLSQNGRAGADVDAAYKNVKSSMEAIKNLSLETARAQLEGSRDQLSNLRASYSQAKQIADESMRAYQGDIAKAATLNPEEQMRLREIDRKRKGGEGLTASELEFAQGFNEFKDYSLSEQERRAKDFGLSDIFSGLGEKAKADSQRVTELAKQVVETELTVTQKHEFILKFEGGDFADESLNQIRDGLKDFEERIKTKLETTVRDVVNRRAL